MGLMVATGTAINRLAHARGSSKTGSTGYERTATEDHPIEKSPRLPTMLSSILGGSFEPFGPFAQGTGVMNGECR